MINGLARRGGVESEQGGALLDFFEQAVDGVFLADPSGRYLDVNGAAAQMLGRAPGAIRALSIRDVVAPEVLSRLPAHFGELAERGIQRGEWRFLREDGSTFLGEVVARRLPDGRLLGVIRDATERHETAERLRQCEERLCALVEAASDVVFQMSPDWSEMRSLRGRDFLVDTKAPNRAWLETYIPPDDRPPVRAAIDRAIAAKSSFDLEHRVNRVDGTIGWTRARAAPIFNESGAITEWIGTASDVTPRRQAEAERDRLLREVGAERDRMSALLASMPDEVWFVDRDERFTRAHPAAPRESGLGSDEAVDVQGFAESGDSLSPDDAPGPAERSATLRALAGETVVDMEDVVRTPAGGELRHRQVNASPVRDGAGAIIGSVAVVRDVTDRTRAEAALRESEERYRTLVESSLDGIVQMDLAGRIQHANPAYQAMVGYSLEELRTMPFRQLTPERWLEAEKAILRDQVLARGDSGEYEKEYIRKGGAVVPVSLRVWPVLDAAGRPKGMGAIVRDITERKQAEEALREAARRKDQFLAVLAHELRNPLAPISNGLRILDAGADSAEAECVREMMTRQVGHLKRLVDDLLEVSRISRGKVELRKERVDLASIVNDAVAAIEPSMKERDHRLTVSLPREPLPLDADPTRLAQTLTNLLGNAAKFTEPGGRIELEAKREGAEVVARVRDNGIGIPAETLASVFDLFTQGGSGGGGSPAGLGIGLALVRSLVEMHGGQVEARSSGAGKGSEFVLRLPLARPADADDRQDSADEAAPEALRRRILVVDDNHDVADSLVMLLEAMGMEVRAAYDGPSALQAAAAFKPEIVFLDLGMPGMDGYETARRLRWLPEAHDSLLVALTGWGQAEHRSRAQEAGFNEHLVKPLNFDVLQRILAERR